MMGSDGKTSTVWSSTDGSAWESIADASSFGAPGQRFVVLGFADDGNGGLIAVGDGFTAGSKVAATAWRSRDGRTWSSATVDFPTNTEMIGLAERPDQIVSAGNGVAWFSRDGSSWTLVALPNATGYIPRAVRAWANGFAIVAVSTGTDARHTKAWISSDGRNWNEAAAPLAGFAVQDLVAYGNFPVAISFADSGPNHDGQGRSQTDPKAHQDRGADSARLRGYPLARANSTPNRRSGDLVDLTRRVPLVPGKCPAITSISCPRIGHADLRFSGRHLLGAGQRSGCSSVAGKLCVSGEAGLAVDLR